MGGTVNKKISGTYTKTEIEKLAWPIAWSGAPDREFEARLSLLVAEARECLDGTPWAVAVEITDGEITATLCEPDNC